MGEAPVLVDGAKKLSQSGVILTYLARKSGKYLPQGEDEGLSRCAGSFSTIRRSTAPGPYRFLKNFAPKPAIPR